MHVIHSNSLKDIFESPRPQMMLLRIIAVDHTGYVRNNIKSYAKAAGCSVDELSSMLDSIEKWKILVAESMMEFSQHGRINFDLSDAYAATLPSIGRPI